MDELEPDTHYHHHQEHPHDGDGDQDPQTVLAEPITKDIEGYYRREQTDGGSYFPVRYKVPQEAENGFPSGLLPAHDVCIVSDG